MAENKVEDAMATEAPLAPITAERKVRADLEDSLPKPYLARAFVAPDTEHPNGTPGRENHGMTVLQQHVSYFDQDKNGIVYPQETFRGLRDLGINVLLNFVVTIIINVSFSLLTKPGFFPSPLLPIYIKNIHKGKHGSGSGTYDMEGRFIPVNFENMFSKYAKTKPDNLTLRELWHMTEANRVAVDFFGGIINKFEWGLVYLVAKDEEGFVPKAAARGVFDGSFFEFVAKNNRGAAYKTSRIN